MPPRPGSVRIAGRIRARRCACDVPRDARSAGATPPGALWDGCAAVRAGVADADDGELPLGGREVPLHREELAFILGPSGFQLGLGGLTLVGPPGGPDGLGRAGPGCCGDQLVAVADAVRARLAALGGLQGSVHRAFAGVLEDPARDPGPRVRPVPPVPAAAAATATILNHRGPVRPCCCPEPRLPPGLRCPRGAGAARGAPRLRRTSRTLPRAPSPGRRVRG